MPTFEDSDFSDVQLERRQLKIRKLMELASLALDDCNDVDPVVRQFLVEAYNTGSADSQNETRGAFKLGD